MNKSIIKIWIAIAVLAGTFLALIYWGAKSYKDSSQSIESLLRPDQGSKAINSLHKFIVLSDLHFNNYTLTNDSVQRQASLKYAYKVDSLIKEIENSKGDFWQKEAKFDTLKAILNEKSRIDSILVDLKRQNSHFFTAQALNRIKLQLSDSAYIDKAITEKLDLITKRDTLKRIDIVEVPDEYRGIGGFFRKIFGKEKNQLDTIVTFDEKIHYDLEISKDSSIVRDYFVDTTLVAVKNILIDVLDEEIFVQRKLSTTELELTNYNVMLLHNIQNLLEEISQSNESSLRLEQESAKRKIETAHLQASIIAGTGIFLGFILLLILIKDITQAHLYRKKLEKEKERAEQLAAAKEKFLSKMSHEIRTPLHSISGFTHLLDQEIQDEKQRKFLTGLNQANHYLNELIGNILEQAKINSGTFKLATTTAYIPDLCREIEVLFKPRQEEQKNNFELSFSQNLKSYQLIIDPIKLKQILINLVGNAFKYTIQGSILLDVNLFVKDQKHELKIQVADTGTGIAPKDQAFIFQPFNQVPGTVETNINGTGLGLSITKYIVDHFGGNISVQSEVGKGSVFTISIPVTCEAYTKKMEADKIQVVQDVYYSIKVLVVEDDKWNAYLLENYLSAHLKEIKFFENAESALEELEKKPHYYDLILTDLNLPQMDGKSFFNNLSPTCSLPVIALSASLSKKEADSLVYLGFSDTLGKPFSKKDLLNAIDKLFQVELLLGKSNMPEENNQIDLNHFAAFFDDQSLPPEEVLEKFITSIKNKIRSFKQAIETTDLKEVGRMAHQLKSNFEQIQIETFSEHLQSIELFAEMKKQNRALEEAKLILPLLLSIVSELETKCK